MQQFLTRARIGLSVHLLSLLEASPRLRDRLGRSRSAPVDGRVLDPMAAAVISFDDLDSGSDLSRRTPADARAKFREQLAIVEHPGPSSVETEELRFEGPKTPLRGRRYKPLGVAARGPAIVYFHGGGFHVGDVDSHDGLCRHLADASGCQVFSLEYRLAPEHPYPAAVADGLAGLSWVFAHSGELGIDPRCVAVAGDSAGGNLSAVCSLRFRGREMRPALQVLFYPATDASASLASHRSMGGRYLLTNRMLDHYYDTYLGKGGSNRREPDASPLFEPDVSGAPPAIVWVAGFDPLRDEGAAYAARLEQAGVPVVLRELSGYPHGFLSMTRALPAAREALISIGQVIGSRLREG